MTRAPVASLTLLAASCGSTATRTTTAAACSTLIVSLGEAPLEPERAAADIRTVAQICRRLETVDGGAQ